MMVFAETGLDAAWCRKVTGLPALIHLCLNSINSYSGLLLRPEDNAGLGEVVGRHFHRHFVAGQDLDVVLAHFPGDVAEHFVPVFQFYPEGRAGEVFEDFALHLDNVVFCH